MRAVNAELRSRRLRQVAGIAVLPVIFVLPIVLVLLLRISGLHYSEAAEEGSDTVISQTHVVREELLGMEGALRGYLLTGDPAFHQSFVQHAGLVRDALGEIKADTTENSTMTPRVARLFPHVQAWLSFANGALDQRRRASVAVRVSLTDKRLMDVVAGDVEAILAAKSSERGAVISRAEKAIRSAIVIVILCGLLAALATGFSVRRILILTEIEQEAARERARLTEARRRMEELERDNARISTADKYKSEYIATMSHELRTPLTAMLGFSEVIRDGRVGPVTPEQAECLDHILKSGHHLLELVGTVLDLAKVEAGKLDVEMVVADPRLPARDVVDGMRELAVRKSIRLDLDVSRAPRQALIDPSRQRQILYNYLANGIKFTPEGGTITVRVLPEADTGFRLEVSDDGIGIAAADVSMLFREFRQVDPHSSAAESGTGLGLALTKRLVEAQGGRVGVTSLIGRGSTFFAVFPKAVAAARHGVEPEAIVA